jgi:alkylation response protein AidB-like acyl-CoA dehydrogenase
VQLDLTAEQELLRSTTAKFLDREADTAKLRALADSGHGLTRDWWKRAAELGWCALLVPEAQGGGSISDAPLEDAALIAEEIGRRVAPGPFAITSAVLVGLTEASTAHRHAAEVDRIVAGDAIATWAAYEPDRGWCPLRSATTATRESEGFRVDGVKDRVEAGDVADLLLVTASLDGKPAQFLVDAGSAGVRRQRMWSLDFTRTFARIELDGVRVPAIALVGEVPRTASAIGRQCRTLRVLQCAETLGAVDRVFAMTLEWAFDRYTFGRVLASYQALKHRFARMKTMLEAMHATTGAAVRGVARDAPDADRIALAANIYVSSRAVDIIQDCVQLHGGIGVTWEHDLHLFLRRACVNRAFYGSPEELRAELGALLQEAA